MGGVGSGRYLRIPGQKRGPRSKPYKTRKDKGQKRGSYNLSGRPRKPRKISDCKYGRAAIENPRAYITWHAMRQRCLNPAHKDYKNYGGRGIKILYAGFLELLADLGERPEGWYIDRIDPDGHYEPGNCRWIDSKTSARNKRIPNIQNLRGGLGAEIRIDGG